MHFKDWLHVVPNLMSWPPLDLLWKEMDLDSLGSIDLSSQHDTYSFHELQTSKGLCNCLWVESDKLGNVCIPMSLLRISNLCVVCVNTSKSPYRCHYGYLISISLWLCSPESLYSLMSLNIQQLPTLAEWNIHYNSFWTPKPCCSLWHSSRSIHSIHFDHSCYSSTFSQHGQSGHHNTHSASVVTPITDFLYRYHYDCCHYDQKLWFEYYMSSIRSWF